MAIVTVESFFKDQESPDRARDNRVRGSGTAVLKRPCSEQEKPNPQVRMILSTHAIASLFPSHPTLAVVAASRAILHSMLFHTGITRSDR
jgi:hypothetical protein